MDKQLLKLLIIEDDHQDFILVREFLNRSQRVSYDITHASSFQEGVQLLIENEYDLILLDYYLDGHTGVDFLKRAKSVGLDIPIIVLTGGNSMELDDILMQLGSSDFIPKDELTTGLLERSIRHSIERKKSEQKIAQLLKRDPLTGLGNRLIFEEHTALAIARAKRNQTKLAIIFMDLDRFKEVNDTLGHHVGDLLLTLVGHRLQRSVRKSDVVARIGGDEFTLLLDSVESVEATAKLADKILSTVTKPAQLGSTMLEVSASMGIAFYPEHGTDGVSLMQKADMALYECKRNGVNRFEVFTDQLQTQLQYSKALEKSLLNAIENSEFELHYQPLVDLVTGEIVGLEALVRWPQSDGSVRMPEDFLSEANQTGLIVPLGEWIIEQVCQQIRQWSYQCPRVSINVYLRQIKALEFKTYLMDTLLKYEIPPTLLEIELTEEAFIGSSISNGSLIQELCDLGIHVSLDDFGTGYSSVQCLKSIPFHHIKIDRSFISGSGSGEDLVDPTVTQSIIFLTRGLSLEVMAEGIESQSQLQKLIDMGCHVGQGHYLYPPMLPEEVQKQFFPEGGVHQKTLCE